MGDENSYHHMNNGEIGNDNNNNNTNATTDYNDLTNNDDDDIFMDEPNSSNDLSPEDLVLKAVESSAQRQQQHNNSSIVTMNTTMSESTSTIDLNESIDHVKEKEKEVTIIDSTPLTPPELRRSQDIQQITPGAYRAGGGAGGAGINNNEPSLLDDYTENNDNDNTNHTQHRSKIIEASLVPPTADLVTVQSHELHTTAEVYQAEAILLLENKKRRKRCCMWTSIIIMAIITISAVAIASILAISTREDNNNNNNNNNEKRSSSDENMALVNSTTTTTNSNNNETTTLTEEQDEIEKLQYIKNLLSHYDYITHHITFLYLDGPDRCQFHDDDNNNNNNITNNYSEHSRGSVTISCGTQYNYHPNVMNKVLNDDGTLLIWNDTYLGIGSTDMGKGIMGCNYINNHTATCYIHGNTIESKIIFTCGLKHLKDYYNTTTATVRFDEAAATCGQQQSNNNNNDDDDDDHDDDHDDGGGGGGGVGRGCNKYGYLGGEGESDNGTFGITTTDNTGNNGNCNDNNDRKSYLRGLSGDGGSENQPPPPPKPIVAAMVLGRLCGGGSSATTTTTTSNSNDNDNNSNNGFLFRSVQECNGKDEIVDIQPILNPWNETTLYCYQAQPSCYSTDGCNVNLTSIIEYDTINNDDQTCYMDNTALDNIITIMKDNILPTNYRQESRLDKFHNDMVIELSHEVLQEDYGNEDETRDDIPD